MTETDLLVQKALTTLDEITPLLWLVLGIAVLVWVFYSSMLLYHWVRYGYKSGSITKASITYFVGSLFFFSVASISLILI